MARFESGGKRARGGRTFESRVGRGNQNQLMELHNIRIITGNSNRALAEEIADYLGVNLSECEAKTHSDGEIHVRIQTNVRGCDVFVIQSTSTPVNDHLMELLILIDALKRASAKRITAVLPYYGYARQDRKVAPRVPITAKLVADLLTTAGAHRVLTMELHAGQIQGFFNIPVDHLFSVSAIYEHLVAKNENEDDKLDFSELVVVSPDAGGMERSRALAKRLNCQLAIVDKRRSDEDGRKNVMHLIGDVKDRDCFIIDDMCDTAGTLFDCAQVVKRNGAKNIVACCIHPVLSGPAIERIRKSPIDRLIVTNTIAIPDEKLLDKIEVLSIAPLFAEAIVRIHEEQSVSDLFDWGMPAPSTQ
eukprot:Rmarinus@m.7393